MISTAGIKRVVREIMSEPNGGTLSWGRVASSVALVAAIVWITRVLILTHSIPALDGITGFVLGPYGANKVVTAAQAFSSSPVNVSVAMPPAPAPPAVVPPPMIPPPAAQQ